MASYISFFPGMLKVFSFRHRIGTLKEKLEVEMENEPLSKWQV